MYKDFGSFLQNMLSLSTSISLTSGQTTPLILAHLLTICLALVNFSQSSSAGDGTFAVGHRGGKGGTLKYPNHPWPGIPLYVVFCCPFAPKVAENFQTFLAK